MTTDPPTSTRRVEGLVSRDLDDEVVVLDLRSRTYYGMNSSARLLWRSLEEGADVDALVATLVAEYAVEPGSARHDVEAFLDALADRDLVVRGAP